VEILGSIASKPMAKAVWEAIIMCNVSVDRVCKVKADSLKRKFNSLTFNDSESIEDFGMCIDQITNQLAMQGFKYEEEEIMRKFLLALPPKFEQIVTSIKMLLDFETIAVDELIGCLKPSE
jgi:hypothetical protein